MIRFGGLLAVDRVSLAAQAGTITGLIGPNGAGKTSTFNACSGLVRPTSGRVLFGGRDISRLTPARRAHAGPGRTFQRVELCESFPVYDNIAIGCEAGVAGGNPLRHVLSRPAARREIDDRVWDAVKLCGLEAVVNSCRQSTFADLAGSLDLIVNTVPASIDLDAYLGLLALDGTLVNIGLSDRPLSIAPFSLITNGRSIAGSRIGGIDETQQMLDFCGQHGIGAEVEVIDAGRIDQAYDRVVAGDVRFRFVIDISTLTAS